MEKFARFKNWLITNIRDNYALLLILLLAFFLRYYGIHFDYPYGVSQIWDESYITNSLDIIQYRTLFTPIRVQTSTFLPVLYIPAVLLRLAYLAVVNGIYNVDELKTLLIHSGTGTISIVVRFCSVAFGLASTIVIYKIYQLLFKKNIALYPSLAYAVAFVPMYLAHWGKSHISAVFFLLLAVYFAIKYEQTKSIRNFYWCVLSAIFSFLAHYVGILALVYPVYAWLRNYKQIKWKHIGYNLLIFAALFTLFYLANLKGLKNQYANAAFFFKDTGFKGMLPVGVYERYYFVFHDTFVLEPVLFSLFGAMFLLNLKRLFKDRALSYVTLGIVEFYLFMTFILVGPDTSRWLLMFVSLTVTLGAALLAERLEALNLKKYLIFIIFMALIIPNLFFDWQWLKLLNNNTRKELTTWAEQNLKKDENIYSFDLYFDAPLSYQAALFHREENGVKFSKKLDYIIDHQSEFENKGLNIFYDIGHDRYKELGGKNTKYFVIVYWEDTNKPGRIPNGYDRKSAQAVIDKIKEFHRIELAKKFYPTSDEAMIKKGIICYLNNPLNWYYFLKLDMGGPFVEVYEVMN